jgi:hypothetical protein
MADRFEAKMNLVSGWASQKNSRGLYRAGVFTAAELDRIRRWSLEVTPPPEPAAA